MPPHKKFAMGVVKNEPDGIYMTNEYVGREMLWVAKRGGIHDWAIYIGWTTSETGFMSMAVSPDSICANGDKVTGEKNIKKLVPCDDEAFGMYRF